MRTRSPVLYIRRGDLDNNMSENCVLASRAQRGFSINTSRVLASFFRYPVDSVGPSTNNSPTDPTGARRSWLSGSTIQHRPRPLPRLAGLEFRCMCEFTVATTAHSLGP